MTIDRLIILIPALPLLATVVTALLGRTVLKQRSHLPIAAALVGSFLLSLALLSQVGQQAEQATGIGWEQTRNLWSWVIVEDALATPQAAMLATPAETAPTPPVTVVPGTSTIVPSMPPPPTNLPARLPFSIDVTLRADALTAIMLAMVTFVATLVTIYASGYMHGDRGYWRFFSYLGLFVFSMTMLVSVSNFVLLYVFWEAVGLCSYLLVGFWYDKPAAAAAGKKAFLVNRVGDFGFALGLFLLWTTYGTLNFHDTDLAGVLGQTRLADPTTYVGGAVATAIALLLMLGACGKSAQFPLHVWLPDAMEGPTPVSALIHAATMVTAGVYMVTRCTPLFAASPHAPQIVAIIGCTTAAIGGIIAMTQTDLKRVLAYSTISQLGYMFLGLGVATLAGITSGMFHLFTHAFFKALLFLAAGSVMHSMGGIIDMRRFSGLRRIMPITHWTFLFGALALAGLFPFAGYWSKDAVMATAYERGGHEPLYMGLFWVALATAFMTSIYTFRAFFLTFYGEERVPYEAAGHAHESPPVMTVPLVILAFCALVVGFVFDHRFAEFLHLTPSLAYIHVDESHAAAAHDAHTTVAALSTILALAGIGISAFLYLGDRGQVDVVARLLSPVYWLSYGKLFFDPIYQWLFVWPLELLSRASYWIDRNLIDRVVNFVGRVPPTVGSLLRSLQMGLVQFYALAMVWGILVLLITLLIWPVLAAGMK